ncbi:hypothetical protein FA13DRAFT_1799669 [Coprinellus micaceus]|uniref:Uncharacterized protein n=1 Tax=Coprinellus micaceus TaxID=71717 RepID=A0A4Y7SIE4_COPMI|nr:hypothetical protein FA13DRAFT_1799669 [Coprinellus micaceus]
MNGVHPESPCVSPTPKPSCKEVQDDTDLQQINVLPDDCPHILLDLDDKPEEPPPTKHPTTNIPKQDHTPSLSVCNNTSSNPCRHHHTPPPQPQEPRYNKSLLSRLARIHDCLKKKVRQLISAYCVANFDTGVPTASPLEGRWRRVVCPKITKKLIHALQNAPIDPALELLQDLCHKHHTITVMSNETRTKTNKDATWPSENQFLLNATFQTLDGSQNFDTSALLDSGASNCYIDAAYT